MLVEAVALARSKGMHLPLVYNSGGYEDLETLQLLDGIIDVYLPDAKYADDALAVKYSAAPNYREVNRKALKEMYRQVGELTLDENGIAQRGLIIRHLVLPENIAGSRETLEFIADELSCRTYLSIMAQYHPAHNAGRFPELSRRVTQTEYDEVLAVLDQLGMENGWIQEL
jgi:putative pyruvate formate lyase activating enzyme